MKYTAYSKKLEADQEYLQAQEELRFAFNFGDAILRARIEKGWSQSELARRVGTRQANISRVESGVANPTMRLMQDICRVLDLDLLTVPRTTAPEQYQASVGEIQKTADLETWLKELLSKSEGKGLFRLCQHKIGEEHGVYQNLAEINWNRAQPIFIHSSFSKFFAEKGCRYWVEFCEPDSNRWEKIAEWPFFEEPEHLEEKT
jgi:transcriptional regulator with XRE-family HTH domain